MTARVHLTIDEVWLEGISPAGDLSELLTRELRALCLRPEVLSALQALPGVEIDRIDGGRLGSGAMAAHGPVRTSTLGAELAAAVTRSLLGVQTAAQSAEPSHDLTHGSSDFGSKEQP